MRSLSDRTIGDGAEDSSPTPSDSISPDDEEIAMMGMGESDNGAGESIQNAVEEALNSPLLGDIDLHAARGALIRAQGGPDMTVSEAERATEMIGERINPRARIIWECCVEPELQGKVRIMTVITGVRSPFSVVEGN